MAGCTARVAQSLSRIETMRRGSSDQAPRPSAAPRSPLAAPSHLDQRLGRTAGTHEHGNLFHYRAKKIRGMQGARVGPFSYDVFLVVAPATSPPENDELGSTTSLGWRCKGRCRQMTKPGHDPALCQPLLLNSLGYGITEHTACVDAQLDCLTSMDLINCDLVSGSLQCYGCGLASKPPVCEK
jgi:hypothetical protein